MKIPGLKYFAFLNVGRLFLKGQEVTVTAEQLNAAGGASVLQDMRFGQVTLNGVNPTRVNFKGGTIAQYAGAEKEGPFDFSAGNATVIVNPDEKGAQTITLTAVAGKHDGVDSGLGDISALTDNKFLIAVDGDVEDESYHEVALALTSCNGGANTATEMQTKIRALGGLYDAVTVAFAQEDVGPPQVGTYTITSGTKGRGSKVRVRPAPSYSITEELGIGSGVDGATNTDGSGVGQNSAEATLKEVADFLDDAATNFSVAVEDGTLVIYGKDEGGSIVVGDGTANAALGLTAGSYLATSGLGFGENMSDDKYYVVATPAGINVAGKANIKGIAVNNKSKSGFDIVCDTDASTFKVDLIVIGNKSQE